MPAQLNHTIVYARDARASAQYLADVLGLPAPTRFGPFYEIHTANDATLAYIDVQADVAIQPQHYAFIVNETEFDEIFARIREQGSPYWADPAKTQPGEINRNDGGRGVYWDDPDGHFLEIITRPYGSGS